MQTILMRNLGGKVFLIEDGLDGLFNSIKYKMALLPNISKSMSLLPEIIFLVADLKMTFKLLIAEQTRT